MSRKLCRKAPRHLPALLESLESRVLLAAPIGSFDYAGRDVIAGWAFDQDNGGSPVSVRISVGGQNFDVTANSSRPDLQQALGGSNFGFRFVTPLNLAGNQTVTVSALDNSTGQYVQLGQKTLPNANPFGSVDAITANQVSGWAFDAENGGNATSIRIDNNGQTFTTVGANGARPDLASFLGTSNHGFTVNGNFGVVDVWAIDNPTGQAKLLGTNNRASFGSVDLINRNRVTGWVYDPDRGATSVRIRVKVDGQTLTEVTANNARPDLQGGLGSVNHGFDIPITLPPGPHSIQVFAIESDTTSVTETLLGEAAGVTNPPPVGSIDVAGRDGVIGWAYDSDSGSTPIAIEIRVDGQTRATVTANGQRNDLTPFLGSANHGFSVGLSGLAPGPHKIELFGIDAPSGQAFKIAQKFIDNTLPVGSLDVASPTRLVGWAFDPDPNATAVQVIYEIDGTRYSAVTANQSRSDLTFLPDTNHAFFSATATHLFGTHTVRVIAIDTFTEEETVIGEKQFVNRAPAGSVDIITANRVAGWVYDPDDSTRSIEVLLRIDNVIVDRRTASNNRPDLQGGLGSTNHGFDISFSGLSSGTHKIELFGVDPATGITQLIGSRNVTV